MSSSGRIGQIILVVLNLLIFVFGLALLVTGILMRANVDVIQKEFVPVLEQVTFGSFNLATLASNLSLTFIVVGALMMVIFGIGLCGACKKSKMLLVIYSIIIGIFLIVELVAVALWIHMQSKVETALKTTAVENFEKTYKSNNLDSDNEISNAWNFFFMKFDCCGVNNVNTTVTGFENTQWCKTSGTDCFTGTSKIPQSCCVGITAATYTNASTTCTASLTNGTYYTNGCYNAIKNDIMAYGNTFIGVGITVLVIELLLILASCCVCRSIEDE